jgi:hypothetical protein
VKCSEGSLPNEGSVCLAPDAEGLRHLGTSPGGGEEIKWSDGEKRDLHVSELPTDRPHGYSKSCRTPPSEQRPALPDSERI